MARDTIPLKTNRKTIPVGLPCGSDLCSELDRLREEFIATSNAVHAMKAFLLAYNNGERQPDWVTDWLYHAFSEFDAHEGLLDLTCLLGLAPRRGKESPYTTIAREEAEKDLMLEIWMLKTAFDLSTGDAADLVAKRIAAAPAWHESNHNLKALSGATLEDRYNRKCSALYGRLNWPSTPADWSREEQLSWLDTYPLNDAKVREIRMRLLARPHR